LAEFEHPIQPQSDFVKNVALVLDEWRALTVVAEKTFVGNLASTIPWIAPLIPAWFAFENSTSTTKLNLPPAVGVIIAASIEGLGISVVTTALELWDWNDRNKDQKITTPLYVSAGTVVFYIVIIVMVNVGLDLGWADWIVKTTLSMLSIPAVVTLALRSQHSRRIAAHEAAEIKVEQTTLADQEAQRRQNESVLEAQLRQNESALEAQRRQMEFDFEQKRLDAETRRQIKLEKALGSKTSESGSGTSKTSETGSGTSGTQKVTFKTGRKSTHRDRVFQWMDEYFKTNGNVPSFSEVEQALSLPQSTASRLRGEWLKEN
jgi:hypothetical protein